MTALALVRQRQSSTIGRRHFRPDILARGITCRTLTAAFARDGTYLSSAGRVGLIVGWGGTGGIVWLMRG
jgi:hypothetical protein